MTPFLHKFYLGGQFDKLCKAKCLTPSKKETEILGFYDPVSGRFQRISTTLPLGALIEAKNLCHEENKSLRIRFRFPFSNAASTVPFASVTQPPPPPVSRTHLKPKNNGGTKSTNANNVHVPFASSTVLHKYHSNPSSLSLSSGAQQHTTQGVNKMVRMKHLMKSITRDKYNFFYHIHKLLNAEREVDGRHLYTRDRPLLLSKLEDLFDYKYGDFAFQDHRLAIPNSHKSLQADVSLATEFGFCGSHVTEDNFVLYTVADDQDASSWREEVSKMYPAPIDDSVRMNPNNPNYGPVFAAERRKKKGKPVNAPTCVPALSLSPPSHSDPLSKQLHFLNRLEELLRQDYPRRIRPLNLNKLQPAYDSHYGPGLYHNDMLNGDLADVLAYAANHGFCGFSSDPSPIVWANSNLALQRAFKGLESYPPHYQQHQQHAPLLLPVQLKPAVRMPSKPHVHRGDLKPLPSINRSRQPSLTHQRSKSVTFMAENNTCVVIPANSDLSENGLNILAYGKVDGDGYALELEPCNQFECSRTGNRCTCVRGPAVEPKDANGIRSQNMKVRRSESLQTLELFLTLSTPPPMGLAILVAANEREPQLSQVHNED